MSPDAEDIALWGKYSVKSSKKPCNIHCMLFHLADIILVLLVYDGSFNQGDIFCRFSDFSHH